MLVKMSIPYDSEKGALLSRDIVGFINYFSKVESVDLASKRGSFGAMQAYFGNRYREDPGFLEVKYGNFDAGLITGRDWKRLGKGIRKTGLLRNASTIALPPTGRSGLVIDASTGVEPLFSLVDYSGDINKTLIEDLAKVGVFSEKVVSKIYETGRLSGIEYIPENLKSIYKTALEIRPEGHLAMVEKIQEAVDESISKTINVPFGSTSEDIARIYLNAYKGGLKGITIFRTGSRSIQPRKLAQ
jgi:ribonucleoside-diphosphate reductase alpha chain